MKLLRNGWVALLVALPELVGATPNFTIDGGRAARSMDIVEEVFSPGDCAIVEGCVGGLGPRTLLRFDAVIENRGTSDLILGTPEDNPQFHFSACHGHYHFDGATRYEIVNSDGDTVATGRKQGFCMEDTESLDGSGGSPLYDCEFQGLMAGWNDVYAKGLDCQWLDITDFSAGKYVLRIEANPEGFFEESNRTDNVVEVPFELETVLGSREPSSRREPAQQTCELVESGFGPTGSTNLKVDEVVSGLEVPWGVAFLPGGDFLVTERPGRVRVVRGGQLVAQPVLTVPVSNLSEGGLLGIAVHPSFATNRLFYIYYSSRDDGNRVASYRLSEDLSQAELDRLIVDGIPSGEFHDGGRIRFGTDGMLYVGTGDARQPELAQNAGSLAGKLLRVSPDGGQPEVVLRGIRNTQGFDWLGGGAMVVTDHGPTGELGRSGLDEVSIANPGDNLGWSTVSGCDASAGVVTPRVAWREALPPGGASIYRGDAIPGWQGNLIVGALGARLLMRVNLENFSREVYLQGEFGRLRDVVSGPDGALYVTTSNCDGRGQCGVDKDKVLRITSG